MDDEQPNDALADNAGSATPSADINERWLSGSGAYDAAPEPQDAAPEPEPEEPGEPEPEAPAPFDPATLPADIRAKLEDAERFSLAIEMAKNDGFDGNEAIRAQINIDATNRFVAEKLQPLTDQLNADIRDGFKTLEAAQAERDREEDALRRELGLRQRESVLQQREREEAEAQRNREFYATLDTFDNLKGDDDAGLLAYVASRYPGDEFGGDQKNAVGFVSEKIAAIVKREIEKAAPGIREKALADELARQKRANGVPMYAGAGSPPPTGAGPSAYRNMTVDEIMRQG